MRRVRVPIEDLPAEPPMPPRYSMERTLRGLRMGPDGPEAEDPGAARARIDALIERALRDPWGLDDGERREAAQELAYRSMEATSTDEAVDAAFAAFALDHECVDALVQMAVLIESDEGRVQALEGTLEVGERLLGGATFFDENRGRFWGRVETRPYMRARHALAVTLQELGRDEEAAGHYSALLELNPEDNQGVRDVLIALQLQHGDLPAARELLARFDQDASALHAWARILERILSGDRDAAARAVRRARRDNPYVEDVLTGRRQVQARDDGYYQPHTESEAAVVDSVLWNAWATHKPAMQWLRDGARSTTSEERDAAVASYAAPVAELLGWGESELEGGAGARAASELTRDHVPELVRMACDVALHEMDLDAPEAQAPLHAIRAIGILRAPEAVEPLLGLVREGFHDQPLIHAMTGALMQIGSPGLPALMATLDEEEAHEFARVVAAHVLAGIGEVDPNTRAEVIAAQARALGRFRDSPARLNAALVMNLASVGAEEHRELMREAFDAYHVSRRVIGSWEDVEEAFELARGRGDGSDPERR